jgi:hypothetical protein
VGLFIVLHSSSTLFDLLSQKLSISARNWEMVSNLHFAAVKNILA